MPLTRMAGSSPYDDLAAAQKWGTAVAAVADERINPHLNARFRLSRSTKIASAGSCFAQRIAEALAASGYCYYVTEPRPRWLAPAEAQAYNYGVYSARYGNVYTPLQWVQLARRALGLWSPAETAWSSAEGRWFDPYRPRIQPDGFSSQAELVADRECHLCAVRELLERLDVFIFTLGMTELWRSRDDGAVFPICPGAVAGEYSGERYEFHNCGPTEIIDHLEEFVALLSRVNPRARVILTVSPVPLGATMTDRHVLQATTYSKSVLRVAAEEMVRRHETVEYFASYEIATATRNTQRYYADDKRSITADGVSHVMRAFFETFGEATSAVAAPVAAKSSTTPAATADRSVVCDEEAVLEALGRRRKEAA